MQEGCCAKHKSVMFSSVRGCAFEANNSPTSLGSAQWHCVKNPPKAPAWVSEVVKIQRIFFICYSRKQFSYLSCHLIVGIQVTKPFWMEEEEDVLLSWRARWDEFRKIFMTDILIRIFHYIKQLSTCLFLLDPVTCTGTICWKSKVISHLLFIPLTWMFAP